jgi:saccharopine dehydrogenase (NAD+, L-lysine-forming)
MEEVIKDYPWMIYGATGRSGELIARKAVAQGLRPILAGRDARAVQKIAEELNLSWRAFGVGDWDKFKREVSRVNLFVNAAGPLKQTSVLVAESCLAACTHYFDLTNQIPSLVAMYTLDAEAKEKNLTLLPGLALSSAVSNCLVEHLHMLLPDADSVDIVLEPFMKDHIPEANLTLAENLAQGGFRRCGGALERYRFGSGLMEAGLPTGIRSVLPSALGDVEAAYRDTKLPNIAAYIATDIPLLFSGVRQTESRHRGNGTRYNHSDDNVPTDDRYSLVWARMSKEGQNFLEGWIEFGEAHEFTATVVIAGVSRLLEQKQLSAGALTPAAALGSDFILNLPNVKRTVQPKVRKDNVAASD